MSAKLIFAYISSYFAAALIFCLLDFIWLGIVMKDFYTNQIGTLLLTNPRWRVAAAFYALYLLGVLFFAVTPALQGGELSRAALYGALLGLLAYGTYNLTNLATIKAWSAILSVVDMAWGAVVTSAAASAGYFAAKIFLK